MRLDDGNTSPLHVSMLKDLHPIPPSIQFISWGHCIGVRKRDLHDKERKKAYGVHFADTISFESEDMVFDWTSENTLIFGDYLD